MTAAIEQDRPLRWTVRRGLAVAVVVLFCGGAVAAIAGTRKPLYQSESAIILEQPALLKSGGLGVFVKLNELRNRYSDLIDSDGITGPAAQQLGSTKQAVASAVSVRLPAQSILLYPTARADTAAKARRIANAITASLVTYANDEQQSERVAASDRVNLHVVDNASHADKIDPSSSLIATSGAVGAAVALVVIAGLLLLPSVRRRLD